MAKDPFEQFAIPNEMRSFAEQSVAQARQAFDGFLQAANQAMGQFQGQAQAARSGAQEIAHKSMTYAEQNVAARRTICAAAGLLMSKRRCTQSRVSAAPNSAAPAAFAHRIREASALHSQAGHGLVANAASRGSRNRASSDSTNVMRRNSLPKEFLIVRGRCGVHGARPSAAGLGRITLIAAPDGRALGHLALACRMRN
jgi:hypothetical protein